MVQDGGIVGVSHTDYSVTAYIPLDDDIESTILHGCKLPMEDNSVYSAVIVTNTVDDLGAIRFVVNDDCQLDTPPETLSVLMTAVTQAAQRIELTENERLSLVKQNDELWNLVIYREFYPLPKKKIPLEALEVFVDHLNEVDIQGVLVVATPDEIFEIPMEADNRAEVFDI